MTYKESFFVPLSQESKYIEHELKWWKWEETINLEIIGGSLYSAVDSPLAEMMMMIALTDE